MYKLGLIGHPVSHSLSPVLHQAAFKHYQIDGEYQLIDIEPSRLESGVQKLIDEGYSGFNVTVPHKQAIYQLCQQLSPRAKQVLSVNTVQIRDGQLYGHNTDCDGLSYAINELEGLNHKRNAIILGSGGAARGALLSLVNLGFNRITLVARNRKAAIALIEDFYKQERLENEAAGKAGSGQREIRFLDCFRENQINPLEINDIDLLVNSIPFGIGDCPQPDWLLPLIRSVRPGFIYDMVYSKTKEATMLVRLANNNNIASCDGLGMLIGQAALAFAFWTNLQAPFQTMEDAASQTIKHS